MKRDDFLKYQDPLLVELDTQLEISLQLSYLDLNNMNYIDELINKLFAKLSNLILKTI